MRLLKRVAKNDGGPFGGRDRSRSIATAGDRFQHRQRPEFSTHHFECIKVGSNRVFRLLLKRAGFLNARNANVLIQKRLKGIEPSSQAWEAGVLPLHHSRVWGAKLMSQAYRFDISF